MAPIPFAECENAAEQRLTQPVQWSVQWHQRFGHWFHRTGEDVGPVFLASGLVENEDGAEAWAVGVRPLNGARFHRWRRVEITEVAGTRR